MCFGSSSPAPDPYATAQAQNAVNKDALMTAAQLNQINQTGPMGSISYSGSIGSPDRTQTTSLSPELQKLLTGQEGVSNSLTDLANTRLSTADQSPFVLPNNPTQYLDNRAVTPLQTYGNGANSPLTQIDPSSAPQFQLLDPRAVNQLQTHADADPLTKTFNQVNGIQQGVNTDFGNLMKQSQDADYAKASGYLDPQFDQQEAQLRSRLSAQGITQGSDAYNQEMGNFARTKQQAYDDARNSAIQTGNNLESNLFGQSLAAGQFNNQAIGQQFGQNQQLAQFQNEAQNQGFGQNMANAQLFNAANGQQFQEGLDLLNYNNNAMQQMYQNQLTGAGFNNQASGQQFQQGLDLSNYNNAALGQQFNEGLQLGNYNNSLYNNNIQNQILGRNQNINEAMSYVNGSPISPSMPSYQPIASSTAAQGSPDLTSLTGSIYNTQQQARAAILGSIFGSLGKVGAAAYGG